MHGRWPLVAYIGLVVVGMVLLAFATQPIIKRYVDRRVQNEITQRLNTDTICRELDTEQCRRLIDRVVSAATAEQEHSLAVRLFRSLTTREIRQLGLRGPRGRRGAQGPRGRTGRSVRGRTGRSGRTGQPGRTVRGPSGAPGQTGAPGPSGPPAPTPSGGGGAGGTPTPGGPPAPSGNPPGPEGNKNDPVPCPPQNKHCP